MRSLGRVALRTHSTRTVMKHADNHRNDGRFAPGNRAATGNKRPTGLSQRVAKLRKAIVAAVTPADIAKIMRELMDMAKCGNLAAARLVLEYTVGKPVEADLVERLDELEALLEERAEL